MNEYNKDEQLKTGGPANGDYSDYGRPVKQRPLTSYERDKMAREAAAAEKAQTAGPTSATRQTRSRSASSGRSKTVKSSSDTGSADSGSRSKKKSKKGGFFNLLYFPVLCVWLELVLHIAMGMQFKYCVIYIPHAIFYGCVFNIIANIWGKRASLIVTKVLGFLISLIFCIEYVAKNILQDFYPASMIKTGMENHLVDYIGAIVQMVVNKIVVILLLILPSILVIIIVRKGLKSKIKARGVIILSVVAAIIFYFLGIAMIHLPWKGTAVPKELYKSDTGYDDQVEQLGLINFLRLDIKHMIWPVENNIDIPDGPDDPITPDDPDEPITDKSANIINLDFDAIKKGSTVKNVQNLASYFSTVTPTRKNEYTGIFEGYNIVFFTVEGLSGYVIDETLTPTLYKLTHEGFVFKNFYTALHFTSTSNGECQNLLGLYPKNGFPITMSRTGELKTNTYFSLARQLNRLGYESWGYHNNINMYGRTGSHPNLGYNWRYIHYNDSYKMYSDCIDYEGSKGVNQGKLRWMQRDSFMIEHTMDDYINSDKPFNVYYMTITGHTPYTYTSWAFKEWIPTVEKLNYSDKTKAYIAAAMECDKALKELIDKLDEIGKLDKTVIVVAPDHIPYFDVDILEELTGKKFGDSKAFQAINERNINFDVYHSCLAIWSPSIADKTIEIDKVCCQVDILPTVSNLMGLEYDSRMLAGTDILSTSEGLVVFSSRCWKSDRGFYNSFTKKFTPAEGVSMTADAQNTYVNYMNNIVSNRLSMTAMIVESNFYNVALGTDKYRYDPADVRPAVNKDELQQKYLWDIPSMSVKEFKDKREIKKKDIQPF